MPKNKKIIKSNNGAVTVIKTPRKLQIGTRKAGKSAFMMSNSDLEAVLENSEKKRYWDNARTVLGHRGVKV